MLSKTFAKHDHLEDHTVCAAQHETLKTLRHLVGQDAVRGLSVHHASGAQPSAHAARLTRRAMPRAPVDVLGHLAVCNREGDTVSLGGQNPTVCHHAPILSPFRDIQMLPARE